MNVRKHILGVTVCWEESIYSVFFSLGDYTVHVVINLQQCRPVQPVVNLPTLLRTCLMTLKILIGKIDDSSQELYLVGDIKTNLLPGIADSNSSKLVNVCEILVLAN